MNKIDYDSIYKEALIANSKEVRGLVLSNDPGMEYKTSNYSEKYNIPKKFLIHRILKDPIFANQFAKDPAKQSIHQRTAGNYIKSLNCVESFIQLPAGGPNARYICSDGIIRIGKKLKNDTVKSIDFYWRYDEKEYYAAHKYTKDEGGAQDNQYKDLIDFLSNAAKSNYPNIYFLAIGDGPFYQRSTREEDVYYSTRINFMNQIYSNDHARAITTDELEEYLVDNSSFKQIQE